MAQADENFIPFWFKTKGGATSQQIAAAEAYIGKKIPDELCHLLKEQNGGVSNFTAYIKDDAYFPLLPFFGVDPTAEIGTLMRSHDVRQSFGVPDGVVVFAGQGNAWWGLDYRSSPDQPHVVYCNEADGAVEYVTESFAAFLEGLTEE